MIKKWLNTEAARAAEMLDVTDDWILSVSHGEVSLIQDHDEHDHDPKKTTEDPDIFGRLPFCDGEEENLRMGHISLHRPVVNIHYFKGERPVLAGLLKMNMKDVEKIIYYSSYVVTESNTPDYAYKQLLTLEEYVSALETHKDQFEAISGAEAIEKLLEKDGIEERKYIILHNIPVIPLAMRYRRTSVKTGNHGNTEIVYKPFAVNLLYDGVITMKKQEERSTGLTAMGAPLIIINSKRRMLQEHVDMLISNGSRGIPSSLQYGVPMDSLHEISNTIKELNPGKKYYVSSFHINQSEFVNAYKACMDFKKSIEDGTYEYNDPTMVKERELEDEVRKTLIPYTRQRVMDDFSRYSDFMNEIVENATSGITSDMIWLIGQMEEDNEPVDFDRILANVEYGIYQRISLFVKKQARWIS